MTYREYEPSRLEPEQQDRITMAVKAELQTAQIEEDLGVIGAMDKYMNIRNIFGSLEDSSEEGNERYDRTLASMLGIETVKYINWNNISEELSDRIDKLYVYGRILFRLHEESYSKIATQMRTFNPQFRKTPLATIKNGDIDTVLLAAIEASER